MRQEIAKYERMTETGKSLLRLMQNQEMPLADLIVRESIQNSLDAGLDGIGHIEVDFDIGKFNSNLLKDELEGIRESFFLNKEDQVVSFLSISDKNTKGLTGPLDYADVEMDGFGNLYNLVYEINRPQSAEGAGGSWGLGKTVYFRAGVGLVFYYSRILMEDNSYQQRLAACLVEDETKDDSLLVYDKTTRLKRGIAWWGAPYEQRTIPLTDDLEIEKILRIFSLEPYKDKETGTRIVIPFIDETRMLAGICQDGEDNQSGNSICISTLDQYLRLSVQKWYAPRLANPNYSHGRWLRCRVNKRGIKEEDFYPLFRVVQKLYNMTDFVNNKVEIEESIYGIEDINLYNVFQNDSRAGQLIFVKADREMLGMDPPDNYSNPYIFLNKVEADFDYHSPVISYVRKPGMVVNYETTGLWTDSIPKTTDGEFIIGLFVLNSKNIIKRIEPAISLEEYIRKSEKADHTSWNDWIDGSTKLGIVSKIQKHCSSKIKKKYTVEEKTEARKNIGLGKALADILLPPENFGNNPTIPKPPNTGGGSGKYARKLNLHVGNPEFYTINEKKGMRFPFELTCKKNIQNFLLEFGIKSESIDIHAKQWEIEIGKPFPLEINSLEIETIIEGKKRVTVKENILRVHNESNIKEFENLIIELKKSDQHKVDYAVEFLVPHKTTYTITGNVAITLHDNTIVPSITVYESGGDI